jgi:prolyl oligopeptidase
MVSFVVIRPTNYPEAPRTDLIETLHGVPVADPFRSLETADNVETIAWVEAENALTRSLLDSPLRDRLVTRLRDLHRVPRVSAIAMRRDRLFFTENDGMQNQAVLYVAEAGGSGLEPDQARTRPRALVDPNPLDEAGTTAITVFEPDKTGDRLVYGLSRRGSDAQELFVLDVADGHALPDRLQWVKFASIAWRADGFFYTRYPKPGTVAAEYEQYFCQVWFHRLGDPQSADVLVYHRPDSPEIVFDVAVTADDRHLVVTSRRGASDQAEIDVVELAATVRATPETRRLVSGFTSGWHFIDGSGGQFYFRTDAGAPFGCVVRIDLNSDCTPPTPVLVVPESHDTIIDAVMNGQRLLVSSLKAACSRLTLWTLDGSEPREFLLPGLGTIAALAACAHDRRAFLTFTSFTRPPEILALDLDDLRASPLRSRSLPFDPNAYSIDQVSYPSKDGTSISMFLVERKGGSIVNGSARGAVLLSGYGGFNISITPSFDPSDFLWLDAGGMIAVANLRGGGEYGEDWHRAGMRGRKQTVFDDFIAAAEWLVSSGRAETGRVAIEGGSNGGLLVGASVVQRPDLFGAAVCRVPVADMLRYHLFTVGRFWIPEYGCADRAEDFDFLLAYSPYHNVVDGVRYPPTLVMTADTDDRVAPGMAKKFAARLQEAARGTDAGPILLRVETGAGHGAGKPVVKQIDEQADLWAFLFTFLTRASVIEQ